MSVRAVSYTHLDVYKRQAFGPGYLDKDNEVIVGLQTDEPLKRACNPFGGMRMVRDACKQYGYEVSPKIEEEFKLSLIHI